MPRSNVRMMSGATVWRGNSSLPASSQPFEEQSEKRMFNPCGAAKQR